MTITEFASHIRDLTRTDSSVLPDAEILRFANVKAVQLAKSIASVDEDYFGKIYTRDLVESATSREYNLPTDLQHRFKRVEAKLNGTDWVVLKELDLSTYTRATDETTILSQFSNFEGVASYDVFRESLWLYTGEITASVATPGNAGLKMWGFAYPFKLTTLSGDTDLSVPSSSTEVAIPKLFHELWADAVSIAWKQNQDVPIPMTEREQNYEYNLAKALEQLKATSLDRVIESPVPRDSSYNDGFNL